MGMATRDDVARFLEYIEDNPETILSNWERLFLLRMSLAITHRRRISLGDMWVAKDIYESITR